MLLPSLTRTYPPNWRRAHVRFRGAAAQDIINFGEDETNTPLLEAFMKEVNKNEGSHLVTIPRGANFSDSLRSS
jgi:hypothetical protein